MKKIWSYFKEYHREEFHWGLYLSLAAFLAVMITLNYRIDLEDSIIDSYAGKEIRMLWYFLLYAGGYYATCLIYAWWKKDFSFFYQANFWWRSLFILIILSVHAAFYYHRLLGDFIPYKTRYFYMRTSAQLVSIFTILLPTYLFYYWKDRQSVGSYYGLTRKDVDIKPYVWLLAAMLPLIIGASFTEGFQSFYPTYRSNMFARHFDIPEYVPALIYELAYGWDFLSVELLFRGFMVIGMVAVIGRFSVLPMVVVYAFLHFGKPAGETISSIFGGYILGIIALYSRNIWGGVIIHMGIAWLMELAAYLQKLPQD
ncbi:CPBP family intramembrane metalloprotease [Cytophagales bacterium LB-30]|uniref:CPBP family intramembrane metalloprotease n=1 Tax=Shiella aurantiaca TaxID=3058365 RepID=A0ABT8F3X5_9BACT|nr:CPBP family intramembrane glutamic endopeptidase [Shiella aurantiaca]MDN4165083.1 CPBP family intramembrane metalloprotease [Shiella aurantiaca]